MSADIDLVKQKQKSRWPKTVGGC